MSVDRAPEWRDCHLDRCPVAVNHRSHVVVNWGGVSWAHLGKPGTTQVPSSATAKADPRGDTKS